VRGELGVATVFNFLGPLANPARARHQVVGVGDPAMAEKMVGVLVANGARRAWVVHGSDGLDELTTTTTTTVYEVDAEAGPEVRRTTVDAAALGLARASLDDLRGGDASANAEAVRRVLDGAKGPHRDIVVLNAAAGLVVGGVAPDLEAGIALASASVDDGRAKAVLDGLVRVSQEAAAVA
jgi:anthranilate phosphoribosyltransferase